MYSRVPNRHMATTYYFQSVQKGQKYADVIYLGMAPALITCQMDDNGGCKVHEKTRQIEVGSQNSSLTFVVGLKLN